MRTAVGTDVQRASQRWGEDERRKGDNTIRIATLNVGRLPKDPTSHKQQELWHWIRQNKIDVCLLTEVGINWDKAGTHGSWQARVQHQFSKAKEARAWNKEETTGGMVQWGGTAVVVTGHTASRVLGKDNDNLGRWASMLLQGKDGIKVRMVSVYVPVKSNNGPRSVYMQQLAATSREGEVATNNPIKQLIADLRTQIIEWRGRGEELVVGGDVNMDVQGSEFARMMREEELNELVLSSQQEQPVDTHRSGNTGRVIDGLWGSASLATERAGMTDFHEWDHRTVWADVREERVFGRKKQRDVKFTGRRLRLGLKQSVQKYTNDVRKHMKQQGIQERVQALEREVHSNMNEAQRAELEAIDRARTEIMAKAERNCRKVRVGKVPFSPQVDKARKVKQFWDAAAKRRKGKVVKSRHMDRLKKKAKLTINTRYMTLRDIEKERQKAWTKWKQVKGDAIRYRRDFLEEEVQQKTASGKTVESQHRKQVLKREETKEAWRKIQWATGKSKGAGVGMVTGEVRGSERKTWTEPEQIAQCFCAENGKKYQKALAAPVFQYGLPEGMWKGQGEWLTTLTSSTRGPDEYTNWLLQCLSQRQGPEWAEQLCRVETEEHESRWKKASERITSGPSGLHFGLWKAQSLEQDLRQVDASMRSISFRTGYNLQRWSQCTDVQLAKQEGNINVEKFRTISLLEADMNMNNKMLGARIMKHAEAHGLIAPEQYGSRKRHRSQEVSLNNRLSNDVMRMHATSGIICANDAKGCYDRIAHPMLAASMQAMGVPWTQIQAMIRNIEGMKHRIQTMLGPSKAKYKGSREAPFQGVTQGHGAAPACWVVVSSPLIEVMRQQDHGFQHTGCMTGENVEFVCFTFVDDTDLIHTFRATDKTRLIGEAQAVAETWNGLLKATGGAIEPAKSHWYLISFVWKNDKWEYRKTEETPGTIRLTKPDSEERIDIERLEATEARRTLGIVASPDGDQHHAVKDLIRKGTEWARNVKAGRLSRRETWRALKHTIWKTLEYPLPVTTMTKRQCEDVMRPVLKVALPAAGVQRNVSRAIVFGPTELLGLGVKHLYWQQLTAHMATIFRHWHRDTLTGKMLRVSYQAAAASAGTINLFQATGDKWSKIVPHSWWASVAEEAATAKLEVRMEEAIIQPRRQGDSPIMDVFAATCNPEEMRQVNLCRRSLQAFWMSDIVSADGRNITTDATEGRPLLGCSTVRVPKVGRMKAAYWATWRAKLKSMTTRDGGLQEQYRLGGWRRDGMATPIRWEEGSGRLQIKESTWTVWREVPMRSRRRMFRRISGEVGDGAGVPADGYLQGDGFRMTTAGEWVAAPAERADAAMTDAWTKLEETEAWALRHIKCETDWKDMATSIKDGTAVGGSDGSVKKEKGTAAWVMATDGSLETIAFGTLEAPRREGPTSSQRAELAGIYSALITVREMEKRYNMAGGCLRWSCDNMQALKALEWEHEPDPSTPDYDMMVATMRMRRQLRTRVTGRHVKGHQDERKQMHELDVWERMNVITDKLAGQRWELLEEAEGWQHHQHTGATAWSVWRRGVKRSRITYDSVAGEEVEDEMAQVRAKRGLAASGEGVADTQAMQRAASGLSDTQRVLTMKLVLREAAVGTRMVQWKERTTAACPRCGATETHDHLWVCQANESLMLWKAQRKRLRKTLQRANTHPAIVKVMVSNVKQASRELGPVGRIRANRLESGLMDDQDAVGWDKLLKGVMARSWTELQARYYVDIGRRRSAEKWAAQIVRKLWRIAWEHWHQRNRAMHHGEDGPEVELRQAVREYAGRLQDDEMAKEDGGAAWERLQLDGDHATDIGTVAVWIGQVQRVRRIPASHAPAEVRRWLRRWR